MLRRYGVRGFVGSCGVGMFVRLASRLGFVLCMNDRFRAFLLGRGLPAPKFGVWGRGVLGTAVCVKSGGA